MAFETLLVEHDGGLAIVTLNRPRQLNALNRHDGPRAGRAGGAASRPASTTRVARGS